MLGGRKTGAILVAAWLAAGPAGAERVRIAPYLEAQQVLDVPLAGDRDMVTFTALAAGVDASVTGRRAEGTISYRYERRIRWGGGDGAVPGDTHSGLARGSVALVPDLLTLDAGAIATRTRIDARGGGIDFLGRGDNVASVYGGYIGPSLSTRVGGLDVMAHYRFGHVRTGDGGAGGGGFALNRYDRSTTHDVGGSVGMKPGTLPFGWTLSTGYSREEARPLAQRYENAFARGEVLVPVAPTLALTAGVGVEDIRLSQQAVRRTAAGAPVIDARGGYVADQAAPRVIAYDFNGLFYDAGVVWRPSRRTTLVATVGRKYGQFAATGSFVHQIDSRSGFTIGIYNGIDSFGRSIGNSLVALPTQFSVPRTGLTNRFDGCVFGDRGTGSCFGTALQSASTSNFRSRGGNALYSTRAGRTTLGLGIGYDERRYLGSVLIANGVSVAHVTDRSVTAQANAAFAIDERSGLSSQIFFGWYDSGLPDAGGVTTGGASGTYTRRLTDRLSGNATVAVYAVGVEEDDTDVSGQLLLGARYQF